MATIALFSDPYFSATVANRFPSSSWSSPVPSQIKYPSCLGNRVFTLYLLIVLEFSQQEKDKNF